MRKMTSLMRVIALLFVAHFASAQVKLGDNPGTIDANAVLELESITKGLLFPRMTQAERNLIGGGTPAAGLVIYNTTTNCLNIRRASDWFSFCNADPSSTTAGFLLPRVTTAEMAAITAPVGQVVYNTTTNCVYTLTAAAAPDNWVSLCNTAGNGLTMTGTTVGLGGTLTSNTTIAAGGNTLTLTGTNPLSLPGIATGASNNIVTLNTVTGALEQRTAASILNSTAWVLGGNTAGAANNFGTMDAFAVPFITSGAERMRIAATGEIGIGTNAPTHPLHVVAVSNPMKVEGLVAGATTDEMMTIDALGVVRKVPQSADWKIVGNAGTSAVGNFIGTTDAIDFVTKTGGTAAANERMRVLATGEVSIGRPTLTTANATFHLGGSLAVPMRTEAADYTVTASDYTIVSNCTGGARTLTLPDPTTCAGRTYILIKGDATANVLNFSRAISLSLTQTLSSVNYNVRLHIQSDGTNWWLIARF